MTAHRHHLRVALDGEIVWLESPLRYRLRPCALNVLAPPTPDPVTTEPSAEPGSGA